jgi:hypothetical protein
LVAHVQGAILPLSPKDQLTTPAKKVEHGLRPLFPDRV